MTAPANSYNWDATTQFQNFKAAYAALLAGTGQCVISCVGDSTTAGVGGTVIGTTTQGYNYRTQSYPGQLASALGALGVPATFDTFAGNGNDPNSDNTANVTTPAGRITTFGSAGWTGASALGGPTMKLNDATGIVEYDFQFGKNIDRIAVDHIKNSTATSYDIAIDGGSPSGSPKYVADGTNNMGSMTFSVAPGVHTSVKVSAPTGGGSAFMQGIRAWDSKGTAIQIVNGGSGGVTSAYINSTNTSGYDAVGGVYAIGTSLAILNIGINDINNGGFSQSSYQSAILNFVQTMQANKIDVILVVPTPINNASAESSYQPELVSALQAIATQQNVPLINLHDRYTSWATQNAKSPTWMFNNLHPAAPLYADEGSFFASVIQGIIGASGGTNTDFNVSPASFMVSGQVSNFTHCIAAAPAPFLINGQPAMLARIMAAATGAFASTLMPAVFAHALAAAPGAVVVAGQAAAFGQAIVAHPGAYAISAAPAAFAGAVAQSPGAFSIAGQLASFADALPMAPSSFVITGQPATFVSTSTGSLLADPGIFTITGMPAAFVSSLIAAPASYEVQGRPATFSTGVLAGAAGYLIAGHSVTFDLSAAFSPAPFETGGAPASFAATAIGRPGGYSITGLPVSFYGSAAPAASPPSRTVSISVAGIRIGIVGMTGTRTALV